MTKGKSKAEIYEENIDLLNLVLGNFVSMGASLKDIDQAFWKKHEKIMNRKIKLINGKFRVSHFGNKEVN